jgi:malate synthase
MTTPARAQRHRLQIDARLVNFIETDALPGTGVSAEDFWARTLAGRP